MKSRAGLTIDAPVHRDTVATGGKDSRNKVDVRTTCVFDVPLARVTYQNVVDLVNGTLAQRRSGILAIDAMNTMGLSQSCVDRRMREAVSAYDVIVPDGMPLVWCMNAKGAQLDDRVFGPYLADHLLTGLERPTRVGLIGGYPPVHDWLRRVGRVRYPKADFTLMYDAPPGPVDDAYVADCAARIGHSGAELVFVCLGVPRQYHWTALAREHLDYGVCVSVGGAFDFVSGTKRIAPEWIQRAGLTWLYRVSQEPRRLGPRYLRYNSTFVWLLITRELLRRGRSSGVSP